MGGLGASFSTGGCSSAWAMADSCFTDAAPPASEPPAVGAALVYFLHATCCNISVWRALCMPQDKGSSCVTFPSI